MYCKSKQMPTAKRRFLNLTFKYIPSLLFSNNGWCWYLQMYKIEVEHIQTWLESVVKFIFYCRLQTQNSWQKITILATGGDGLNQILQKNLLVLLKRPSKQRVYMISLSRHDGSDFTQSLTDKKSTVEGPGFSWSNMSHTSWSSWLERRPCKKPLSQIGRVNLTKTLSFHKTFQFKVHVFVCVWYYKQIYSYM